MKKMFVSVLVFVFSGVSVYAEETSTQMANTSGAGLLAYVSPTASLVADSTIKKVKKVDCKKKKNKKKKECKKVKKTKKTVDKTTKSNSEVNQDPGTYNGANYTGSFPAPEGVVLEGTSGEDQFKDPTGDGKYRFKIQTAWKNHLACLDKTRTIIGSKGKTWEEGWYYGYDIGSVEGQKFVTIYDETPQGKSAGNEFYDEGYRLGYKHGFSGGSLGYARYECSGHDVDLSEHDDDGWYKLKSDKILGLKSFYLPPNAGVSTGSSLLGNNGVYVSLGDASDIGVDKSASPINLSRVDFLESELDAAEQKMTMSELAQASYDLFSGEITKKYGHECVVDSPLIEDAAYGKNTFTNLNFVVMCSATTVQLDGSKKVDGKWMLSVYSFKKLANNKMLVVQLFSPVSVKAKDKAELDTSKFPSADFINQLYSKMQF